MISKTGATSSGIIVPVSNEEVFSNPLYEVMRSEYQQALVSALQGTPLIVLPTKSVLSRIGKSIYSTRKFAEAHILQSAHIPGLFCSGRGQGVELRNDRLIMGGKHVVSIIQSETILDFSNSFRIVIVDKPLDIDACINLGGGSTESSSNAAAPGSGPSEWLAYCPMIENDYYEKLVKLKKTFLLASGFEHYLAQRIREMSTQCAAALMRYLPVSVGAELPIVFADIERISYATLHSHLMTHFRNTTPSNTVYRKNLASNREAVLREIQAPLDLLAVHVQVASLIESRGVLEEFKKMELAITPQQKINGLAKIVDLLGRIFSEAGVANCSSEHLIAAMTMSMMAASLVSGPIHMAHMEMFLTSHPELAMDKASFAVATFNSSLEFLSSAVLANSTT